MSGDYGLGLDGGTTKLCFVAGGEVVEIHHGFPTCASAVRIRPDGSFTIPRRVELPSPHSHHLTLCKRLIGRPSNDGRLRHDVDLIPHAKLDEHGAYYTAGERRVELVEVWGYILGCAKRAAELKHGGKSPQKTVLTVPAYYGISQCEAIRSAAEMAGFDMKNTRLVSEPVAILVDQVELDRTDKTGKYPDKSHVVVVDIGGGTCDITEVYFDGSKEKHTYVIQAIEGDNFLGGTDCDQCIVALAGKKAKEAGYTYKLDGDKLLLSCENAKEALAHADVAKIELPAANQNQTGSPHLITVTRDEFEKECEPLVKRVSELIDRLPSVRDGKAPTAVLLAGGASQMHWVKQLCEEKFPNTGITLVRDAATTVARGGCRISQSKHITIRNVLSKSIGVESYDDPDSAKPRVVAEQVANRNIRVPTKASYTFFTMSENQSEVELAFVEGESLEPGVNTPIDKMTISGIPNCKAGTEIRVELTIKGPGDFTVKATIEGHTDELTVVPKRFLDAATIEKYKNATARRLNGEAVESRDVSLDGESVDDVLSESDEDADLVQEATTRDSNNGQPKDGSSSTQVDPIVTGDGGSTNKGTAVTTMTSSNKRGASKGSKAPVSNGPKSLATTAAQGKKRQRRALPQSGQPDQKKARRLQNPNRGGSKAAPTRLS